MNIPGWLEDGRQHGYPDCCIIFFHRFWAPLCRATAAFAARALEGKTLSWDEFQMLKVVTEHKRYLDESGYVPCPNCLAKEVGVEHLPSLADKIKPEEPKE